jgi:uncharacterized protein YdhG (YjbR/CyaY superfamily)
MKATAHARTPTEYVASLPRDRREAIAEVRDVVRKNMPKGFHEEMLWGVIGWGVPLSRYPNTYNKHPLCYVALASQKNYCSLYMMGCYGDDGQLAALKRAFAAAGKKLDMGKSCIHFQRAADLPLDAIGKLIAAVSVEKWIEVYEKSRLLTRAGKAKAAKTRA